MRWNVRKKTADEYGDDRERHGFLFWPKTIDGETRWLERASWLEYFGEKLADDELETAPGVQVSEEKALVVVVRKRYPEWVPYEWEPVLRRSEVEARYWKRRFGAWLFRVKCWLIETLKKKGADEPPPPPLKQFEPETEVWPPGHEPWG